MFNKFKFLALGAIGFVPVVMFSCGVGQKVETKDDEKPLVSQVTSNKEVELKQNNTTSNLQTTIDKNQSSNANQVKTTANQSKKPRLSREEALKKLRETKLPQLLPPTEYDKQLAKEKKQQEKAQFEELNGFVFILDGNRKYSINKYNLLDNGTYEPNPKVLNAMIEVDGKQIHQYIFSGGKIIPNPELKNIG